ncbi:MAG: pilus assembly PilX N-terminal domain-containing protein [Terriglobia bacterium]
MKQAKEDQPRQTRWNQRGVALVTVLLFLLLLVLLAAALLGTSVIEVRVSDNYQRQTEAFYIAEAGVEQAKQWLKTNMGDAELMSLLLQASQNNPPDQSTLVRADATVVNTPLGNQTFPNATGTYTVVIRDNADDADLTVDTDLQWIINSRGDGPNNSSKIIEVEVAQPTVNPSGAINAFSQNAAPAFNQGTGGTGVQIPLTSIDGNAYDINGNPVAVGCPAVPALATDSDNSTTQLDDALDDLRSRIVKRANQFCNADGTSMGGGCDPNPTLNIGTSASNCCTPGLWWVRGTLTGGGVSGSGERYDENPSCNAADPECSKNLDLSAPELQGIDAAFNSPLPDITLPVPPTAPFAGAPGNVPGEPLIDQVPPADMQEQIDLILDAIASAPPGDKIQISDGRFNGAGASPPPFGSPTNPVIVEVTDNGGLQIQNGASFSGYGILVVPNNLQIDTATLDWRGIVIVQPPTGSFRSDDGMGQIIGALYLMSPTGTVNINSNDSNQFGILYSCEAIAVAVSALPLRTVSWIELHQ